MWKRDDLLAVDPRHTRHLLGLFEPGNMHYEADRAKDAAGEPSLAEMTRKAIEMLGGNSKGFYLVVEGGCIDHGHHLGNAYRALTDTIAFSDAVRLAASMTSSKDTLILVTADHSHVLTISGYPARGNPILGLVKAPGATAPTLDYKGQPYTTLSYATGPGFAMQDESVPGPRVVAPGRGQDSFHRGHDVARLSPAVAGGHGSRDAWRRRCGAVCTRAWSRSCSGRDQPERDLSHHASRPWLVG